ncbi:MAG: M23 family metallopeptidase [Minisyncoccia bacterium]|jgi:murein DD-endopeptidase MepM/ murein hydrolase activator NlpD
MLISISTIVKQLYGKDKPLTVAAFLVMGCLLASAWFSGKTGPAEERGVLGGPASSPSFVANAEGAGFEGTAAALLANDGVAPTDSGSATFPGDPGSGSVSAAAEIAPSESSDNAAIKDTGTPIGPAFDRSGMISYVVQKGDTLSQIASNFGISVDTIVSANPDVRAAALAVGTKLKILPTSGVVYQTKSGDTLESISDSFGIPQDKIVQFNQGVNFGSLDAGTPVIIPGGTDAAILASASVLPDLNGDFIMPTNGYDWGILHHYNAVDIANSCGTPVVAAAEGLVVPDDAIPDTIGGWNEGYGNFVFIEHPFGDGVRTRYAHLEKILVQIGDYVKQGQVIGLMGETGDATGCHVHFEVYGAQNPFAKT